MTKTEYEKELEREIDEKIEVIERLKKKLDKLQFELRGSKQIIEWDTKLLKKEKLEAYKKGKQEGRKEGLEDKEQEMLIDMRPLLFLLERIERGEFFEEDDKELNWKKALKKLKNKFKEYGIE